jgi:hypothetical protein
MVVPGKVKVDPSGGEVKFRVQANPLEGRVILVRNKARAEHRKPKRDSEPMVEALLLCVKYGDGEKPT